MRPRTRQHFGTGQNPARSHRRPHLRAFQSIVAGFLVLGAVAGAIGWHALKEAQQAQAWLPTGAPQGGGPAPVVLLNIAPAAAAGAGEQLVADLHLLAKALDLSLRDYTLEPAAVATRRSAVDVVALRGTLQLQGKYVALRSFFRQTAERHPGLTLTQLELSRAEVSGSLEEPVLEARLSFALLRLPSSVDRTAPTTVGHERQR